MNVVTLQPALTMSPGRVLDVLARTLRDERNAADLHPAVAAFQAQLDPLTLRAYEAGEVVPPWPTLARLLALYETPGELIALCRRLMEESDLIQPHPSAALAA